MVNQPARLTSSQVQSKYYYYFDSHKHHLKWRALAKIAQIDKLSGAAEYLANLNLSRVDLQPSLYCNIKRILFDDPFSGRMPHSYTRIFR